MRQRLVVLFLGCICVAGRAGAGRHLKGPYFVGVVRF